MAVEQPTPLEPLPCNTHSQAWAYPYSAAHAKGDLALMSLPGGADGLGAFRSAGDSTVDAAASSLISLLTSGFKQGAPGAKARRAALAQLPEGADGLAAFGTPNATTDAAATGIADVISSAVKRGAAGATARRAALLSLPEGAGEFASFGTPNATADANATGLADRLRLSLKQRCAAHSYSSFCLLRPSLLSPFHHLHGAPSPRLLLRRHYRPRPPA